MARREPGQDLDQGGPNNIALTSAVIDQGVRGERELRHHQRRRDHVFPRRLRFPSVGSCAGWRGGVGVRFERGSGLRG